MRPDKRAERWESPRLLWVLLGAFRGPDVGGHSPATRGLPLFSGLVPPYIFKCFPSAPWCRVSQSSKYFLPSTCSLINLKAMGSLQEELEACSFAELRAICHIRVKQILQDLFSSETNLNRLALHSKGGKRNIHQYSHPSPTPNQRNWQSVLQFVTKIPPK